MTKSREKAGKETVAKLLLKSGLTAAETARRLKIRVQQIYIWKRLWNLEAYKKNPKYQDPRYKAWRLAVFKRDGFRCQSCGFTGDKYNPLQAHHLHSQYNFPKLKFLVENGMTLCLKCHRKTDSFKKRQKIKNKD